MRRTVIVAAISAAFVLPAVAADMPVKAKGVMAPPFSWTGCYVGANAGYAWGRATNIVLTPPVADVGSPNTTGAVVGGQIGCDYQFGAFVVGAEGMLDWADIKGSVPDPLSPTILMTSKMKWFGTATARFGYAFDRNLVYVKGGGVWLDDQRSALTGGVTFSDRGTRSGWTVGGGFERSLARNWSAKIEYNYLKPSDVNGVLVAAPFTFKNYISVGTVGVNYRF